MTWVIRNGELIERGSLQDVRPVRQQSGLPCPMVRVDSMNGLQSMQDGKIYESRSQLYRSYADAGVRIFEKGEKPSAPERQKVTKAEVAAALNKVRAGYRPGLSKKA